MRRGNFIYRNFISIGGGKMAKAKSGSARSGSRQEPESFRWLLPLVGVVGILLGLGAGYVKWGWPVNWYAKRDADTLPPGPENDLVRYGWKLVNSAGGVAAEGIDVLELDVDGRIGRVVGFFGTQPAALTAA